jgi:hypothetical protein
MKYYGIGKEGELFSIFLGDVFLKIYFREWKLYYYNKHNMKHCIDYENFNLRWFVGFILGG